MRWRVVGGWEGLVKGRRKDGGWRGGWGGWEGGGMGGRWERTWMWGEGGGEGMVLEGTAWSIH